MSSIERPASSSLRLTGVRALVTGSSEGLGLAIAERFARDGASVFLCARRGEPLRAAAEMLSHVAAQDQRIGSAVADVSRPDAVARLVTQAVDALEGLDVLVCNAGINGAKGLADQVEWRDWVQTIEINLFGAVLCCRAALPHFRAKGRGKIILLSGGGATGPRPYFSAYAASKSALVRFGETLAEEVRHVNIDVNAVAPGALNTSLLDDMLAAGPEKIGAAAYERCLKQKQAGGTPLDTGARLCAFLASSESDGITGRLISAVWDPWEDLPARREELAVSDVYTLRRIVPEDRGKDWGPAR
jgi:NAD(P)-dependent dehydrogenase (short-subunit alcohol dehydrogenase family)